jgi:hypothetical protein
MDQRTRLGEEDRAACLIRVPNTMKPAREGSAWVMICELQMREENMTQRALQNVASTDDRLHGPIEIVGVLAFLGLTAALPANSYERLSGSG